MDFLTKAWNQICDFTMQYVVEPIMGIGVKDVIDILLLTILLFEMYRFFHTRRAGRVVIGLAFTVVVSALVVYFKLPTLTYLVNLFASVAFFCAVVIFQPEFRDALEHVGNLTIFNPRSNTLSKKKLGLANEVADETTDAVMTMASNRTGALIVFEGLTQLGDYTHAACILDARVSSKLLQNIFYNGSPLHDGALIIRKMRIYAANCVLPSSTRKNINFGLMGTRHRAAVGVTEVSDALVIVVSEQTGRVSVAQNGKLIRDIDRKALKDILMTYMAGNAYLRQKRAGMRKEYLEVLENVARIEQPQNTKTQAPTTKTTPKNAEPAPKTTAKKPENVTKPTPKKTEPRSTDDGADSGEEPLDMFADLEQKPEKKSNRK
ncbi:MAG: diadenylate cyclase CdaA [Clostridia bacterium]|nr:diadenylate cyclase CdaA [Clostridia bacterium]